MLAGSAMSSGREAMPGLAAVVSSSACLRRPAMMTWFPRAWNASARPRPMPEPPPVIRIVLPLVFMVILYSCPRRGPEFRIRIPTYASYTAPVRDTKNQPAERAPCGGRSVLSGMSLEPGLADYLDGGIGGE